MKIYSLYSTCQKMRSVGLVFLYFLSRIRQNISFTGNAAVTEVPDFKRSADGDKFNAFVIMDFHR